MSSTALYTDLASVVRALAFQSPETLGTAATAGTTSITLNVAPPSDWQVGSTLVVDANNPTLAETVTIEAAPSGTAVTISALVNNHAAGAPVINGTIANDYVTAASRWFDSQTYVRSGFAYEPVTDTKEAYIDRDGYVEVPLSKPKVVMSDVTSVTFQATPMSEVLTLDLTKGWILDNYFLKIAPENYIPTRNGLITVTYSGGYNPVPDNIQWAVTNMAARFYKERDSGYSDVIGSADTGIFQYKKAMPADVKAVVLSYMRWTE